MFHINNDLKLKKIIDEDIDKDIDKDSVYNILKRLIKAANYNNKLIQIIKEIGFCNESGEWVDKNSGEFITLLDYDVEEGYEDGFKVSTRSVLEVDTQIDIQVKPNKLSPLGQVISNVIETLSNNGKIISQELLFLLYKFVSYK